MKAFPGLLAGVSIVVLCILCSLLICFDMFCSVVWACSFSFHSSCPQSQVDSRTNVPRLQSRETESTLKLTPFKTQSNMSAELHVYL